MTILIRMLNTPLDLRLVDHVRASLLVALGPVVERVRDVRVVIEDVPGPGAFLKDVRIVLVGTGGLGTLTASATDAGVEAAFALALDRLERGVARANERSRLRARALKAG